MNCCNDVSERVDCAFLSKHPIIRSIWRRRAGNNAGCHPSITKRCCSCLETAPRLVPELLRDALQQSLPEFTEARVESADLTNIQPAEYRADLVVLLLNDKPVLGVVVEAQLARDDDKHYAWPAYVANLRTRFKCPVCLCRRRLKDGFVPPPLPNWI